MDRLIFSGCLLLAMCGTAVAIADDAVTIAEARRDGDGFLVHEVRSPYQAATTQIRVLLPDKTAADMKYPVVYVLPVEAGIENRYGDGLKEIRRLNLHNRLDVMFVAPTYSHLPWYADHPTNLKIRQESYFVKVIVPFIDRTYPVPTRAEGRLLLGFSKSGWGAWSLLLRHPDLFSKAVAWDAPLMMDRPGKYGSGEIFGTAENFEAYRVSRLLENRGSMLGDEKRLILLGYGNFRSEHQNVQALLDTLKIAHEYRDGPQRKHDWESGWVGEAVELLVGKARSR